ncbi:MAG: amino acid racemase [Actinomycetales bacterium]|nr:amino acid racemase [Actinomycetales bacterium]
MRKIGLLGGMSWQSSIEYERAINQIIADRLGGTASADLLIRSFNFAEVEALQAAGDWAACADLLATAAISLETAGAEAIAICTNTMHNVADSVEQRLTVPLLHIADATGEAALAKGLECVSLFGTRFTMEMPFLRQRLESKFGLRVITPDNDQRAEIHRVIYQELVQGRFLDESRDFVLGVMRQQLDQGAQGIIAGCTEIEQLVTPSMFEQNVGAPYFPTAALHARAIAHWSLGD